MGLFKGLRGFASGSLDCADKIGNGVDYAKSLPKGTTIKKIGGNMVKKRARKKITKFFK